MKKIILCLFLFSAIVATAQNPLPTSRVYGDFTVDSVFANTNGNTGHQLINDSLAIPGEPLYPFSGSAYNDVVNDVYYFTGVSNFGAPGSTIHAYNYTTGQETVVAAHYFSDYGKQGVLIKSNGRTGEGMTAINVFDEVTVFARDTTNAPAFNVMSWDGTGGRSDSLTMFSISRKGEAVLNGPSGSLGIGTNTPTATMDVLGTALISNDTISITNKTVDYSLGGAIDVKEKTARLEYKQGTNLDTLKYVMVGKRDFVGLGTQEGITIGSMHRPSGWVGVTMAISNEELSVNTAGNLLNGDPQNELLFDSEGLKIVLEEGVSANFKIEDEDANTFFKADKNTVEIVADLKLTNGSEGLNKVLTSDADGVATWSNINTVNAATIPAYADNSAAVTGIGAGKLYYVDVSGEHEVRISH